MFPVTVTVKAQLKLERLQQKAEQEQARLEAQKKAEKAGSVDVGRPGFPRVRCETPWFPGKRMVWRVWKAMLGWKAMFFYAGNNSVMFLFFSEFYTLKCHKAQKRAEELRKKAEKAGT